MKSQVFALFATALCSICSLAQITEEITIEPDLEIQTGIREVILAVMDTIGPAEKRELELGLERLLAASNNDRQFLMLQVIYWAGHAQEPGMRDHAILFFAYVFEQLHFSDEEILEMALPYLTEKTPYNVRYLTRGILVHIYLIDEEDGSTTYDFSFFANRIANQSDQAPRALDNLIDFIYYEGPGEAVLALMRAHGASGAEIAAMQEAETYFGRMYRRGYHKKESNPELDMDKVMAYLDQYSQSEHWWERLYVATMLGEVRQLRTDPVLRRLKSDLHPVIRRKLSGVQPKEDR